jgi:hypothetical protein
MKKLFLVAFVCLTMAIGGGLAIAGPGDPVPTCGTVNNLNEPGSLLVYPLVQNTENYSTIIEITNRSREGVWLQGYFIGHGTNPVYCKFEKKNFFIHLTQKEVWWWDTGKPYNRTDPDGITTQIQSFNNRKGFIFVWAIDSDKTQLEIDHDYLKGDAVWFKNGLAFQYNAIPHQMIQANDDRVLDLDGVEYTMATSQILVEGFAQDFPRGMRGKLVVCSLDIDFINSKQPAFDINFEVWNQNEVPQSRHLDFCQFQQYDLRDDLQLRIDQIFTPKWQMATSSTDALWAVFYQAFGNMAWGGNVWQHPTMGATASVILPPVPGLQ